MIHKRSSELWMLKWGLESGSNDLIPNLVLSPLHHLLSLSTAIKLLAGVERREGLVLFLGIHTHSWGLLCAGPLQ